MDSQGVYHLLKEYNSMLQQAKKAAPPVMEYRNVNQVVICGMGGSGVIGEFASALVDHVPVTVVKDYSLPRWVGHDSLVICISYSGNTEETLSCLDTAIGRGSLVVGVTSGGEMLDRLRDGGLPCAVVPQGLPPRFATVHMLVPVLGVLQELGITEAYGEVPERVLVDEKSCVALARQLVGKVPLVYASHRNRVLAAKLKTDINENAKVPAFFNEFPESNHNELNSYEHITPSYAAIFLCDPQDHPRVQKRMRVVMRLLRERQVPVHEVPLSPSSDSYRLLHGNLFALYTSYHLAMQYGIDPGPVQLIERFKELILQE